MARSLKVAQQYIQKVKAAVVRNKYRNQQELAEDLQLGLSTISNFLNGRPVDAANFQEICRVLALDWREIEINKEDISAEEDIGEPEEESRSPYVERPAIEARCREILLEPGALLRLKAPRQMGKTTLINRVLKAINQQGYRTVYLHLDLAERIVFTDLDKFLQWFCIMVGNHLGLPHRLADHWDHQFCTSKVNATAYFEEYLLVTPRRHPLVLCLDKVDRVFRYPTITSDFLGLLRAWHEQAKAKDKDIWKHLRLAILHSEEPFSLSSYESPFNVGVPVELPELNTEQVATLANQYTLLFSLDQLEHLMTMVGGHPYLVQQILASLKANPALTLEQVLQKAPTESGIYCNHLRDLWQVIQKDPSLAEAVKQVITASTPIQLDLEQANILYRMGLVKHEGNDLVLRCQLYQLYFQERFGVAA